MTAEEAPARSMARAHLSQLVDMFGSDGCLRVSTIAEGSARGPVPGFAPDGHGEPEGDERT